MIAHTQTLFGSVALVAVIMGCCLLLTGQFNRRDGLITAGIGLLAHALAYVCYALYGHVPLWLSYLAGNTLLATAMAFYAASLYRIGRRRVPWPLLCSGPAAVLLGVGLLLNTLEPRMLLACLVMTAQCLLIIVLAWRYGRIGGRAHWLVIGGASISLIGLALRIIAIFNGDASSMRYDSSGLIQAISVSIGTFTVIMISLGVVLLAKEQTDLSLRALALRDPLTGLLNRRAIMSELNEVIARARRSNSPAAVVMLDIDHFKQINDRHGHLIGDEVLCQYAKLLQSRLRQTDHIGRYGGEEFLLILPDTPPQGACAIIESLRSATHATPALHVSGEISVSFSAGIWCGVPNPQQRAEQLIERADDALYASKAAGRNTLRLSQVQDLQTS